MVLYTVKTGHRKIEAKLNIPKSENKKVSKIKEYKQMNYYKRINKNSNKRIIIKE